MIENLTLDHKTGHLFWTAGPRAGRRAGSIDKYGYRQIGLEGKVLRAHRVVWRIAHGVWPVLPIDHINGVRDDNRPENLREADPLQQMRNRASQVTNTSGVTGVTVHRCTGKWQAGIGVNGKHVHLGLFENFSDAVQARVRAEETYGFHKNHGRVAP